MALAELEHRAGVGHVAHRRRHALLVVPLEHLEEARELQPRRGQIQGVRVGEVGVDALHLHAPAVRRPLEEPARVVVVDADPLHARVDLEVHGRGDAQPAGDLVDLFELVDGRRGQREPVAQEDRDLVAEDAAHDQDGHGDAGLAQRHRFFQERHAQRPGPERDQVPGHGHEPVAVGIGLHDRHHRGRRDRRLDRAEVLRETGEADLDDRRPQRAGVHLYLGTMPVKRGMTSLASSSIEWCQALGFSL